MKDTGNGNNSSDGVQNYEFGRASAVMLSPDDTGSGTP
jgi:hypothetical protein